MKFKDFVEFNLATLDGASHERHLEISYYNEDTDTVFAKDYTNREVTIKGIELIDIIIRCGGYYINNPEILKGTDLIKNYMIDRKIKVQKITKQHSIYNGKFTNRFPIKVDETQFVITVERWTAVTDSGYIEIFNDYLFSLYLENDQNTDLTFKQVWLTIQQKVKKSWVLVLSKEEKEWLKQQIKEEIQNIAFW